MKDVFTTWLVVIGAGLAYMLTIGFLGRSWDARPALAHTERKPPG